MKTLFLLAFIIIELAANATNYYFSASGNDANNGTSISTPWQTISKFNSIFSSRSPGDSLLFKRGDTFYGTLVISRSGTAGSPIIIGAYGTGAKPIITGLSIVSAWTSLGGGIYESTSAVTTNTSVNMVTFQDTLQPMGRWPKLDNGNGGYLTHQTHSGLSSITSNAISGALSYVGGEVVIRKNAWILDRARITAQTSSTVSFTPFPSPDHPGFTYPPIDGNGFFFQNHVNACTILGEWAYDSITKKIKMNFSGATPASYTIKVADVDYLVNMQSAYSYITFDNITFRGSNKRTFYLVNATFVQINHCTLDLAGENAIYAYNNGTNNIQISYCTITNTNNNAITAQSGANWNVLNNDIRNTGMVRGMGQSGDGQYFSIYNVGDNSLVQYNRIKNSGYTAISFKGDFVLVKNNFVDSFCIVKSDGGGIYTYLETTKTGRRIISNIVLNGIGDRYGYGLNLGYPYNGGEQGIYLDGGARNVLIDNNTAANCGYAGILLQSPIGITVTNNTFYNNTVSQIDCATDLNSISNLIVKHNIFFAKQDDQLVYRIRLTSNYLATMGTIDSNYYCRPIYEPAAINTVGHSHGADWSFPYNDGGINMADVGAGWRFYSLDTWKTISSQDAATVKTPKTITDVNDLRFEYNATNSPVVNSLPYNYMDATGATYSGTITISPYSSVVLIRNGAITNQPPQANAGPDETIILPSNTINLSGSGTDPDGTISSYLWTKISGPTSFTIANINSASTSVIGLVQGVYKFELKVTDNNGAIGKDTIQVIVNAAPNQAPTANAGNNVTLTLPTNSTTLTGSGTDSDGTIVSYAWSRVSGPTTFTLGSANAVTTTLNNLVPGTYVFSLTVTDNGGATTTDNATVTVNAAPQCSSTAALGAGSIINDNSIGVFNFSSPGHAAASDNSSSSASAIITILTGNTNYLKATGFNFALPSTASICGIMVEVEKSASDISLLATVTDNSVRLVKGGIITGNNYATATDWSSTENYYSYGGVSDLWGTTWTPAEINATDFGLVFSAHIIGLVTLLPSALIDHVRVTVYYNIVLPVQLTAFSARVQDAHSNLLQWTTHDNDEEASFTIQRSSNGNDWKNIQTLKGEINAAYKTYEFNDACSDALVYYRILIMHRDGSLNYSAIARISRLAKNILSIYPNPANNYLLIDYPEKLYNIVCISANGQTYAVRFQKNGGSNYTGDIRHLPKGIYIIRLNEKSRMFVKQ